jgi:hypothetical protein
MIRVLGVGDWRLGCWVLEVGVEAERPQHLSPVTYHLEEIEDDMDVAGINPIVAIIIGLLLIGLVFRIIKGVIRLVLIVGIFAFLAYILLNYAR